MSGTPSVNGPATPVSLKSSRAVSRADYDASEEEFQVLLKQNARGTNKANRSNNRGREAQVLPYPDG